MEITTCAEVALLIDHSILHPTFTDNDLEIQCALAAKLRTATVCVKPYHVEKAAELLKDSGVSISAVIGFPHGNCNIEVKVFETLQVIVEGAKEVDMVINIGKALQGDWDYIKNEIEAVHDACIENKAILKVIFETDYITKEEDIIKLCEICNECNIEFVKTSTGFGFVKNTDGKYICNGATNTNIKLMREYCIPEIQVKASGGIRNLTQLLSAVENGATRIGTSASEEIIQEAYKKYGL
jgi:deoxyribose-phosphate aldolase